MKLSPEDHPLTTAMKALITPSYLMGATQQNNAVIKGMSKKPQDSFDHGNNKPTVLLNHGFLCNAGAMNLLGEQLKERVNVVFAPDYTKLNTGDLELASMQLREKIRLLLQNHEKNGDLVLVGHSTGGLEIIQALQGIENEVHEVITCATPFKGTPQAQLVSSLSKAARQLSPHSYFLHRFNQLHMNCPVNFHISMADSVIPPINQVPSIKLSHALWGEKHEKWQHFDFIVGPKSKEFANLILERMSIHHKPSQIVF